MNDKKERVYSEQDLCEYTILQKIDELEKQLKNIKNEFNGLYETKEDASTSHTNLSNNIASVDSDLQSHIEENVIKFRDIDNTFNHIDKFTPTDVGIKNNKLGLQNGSTWLTNRNAINIGDGLTYDETTNTLKASGGISVGGGISVIELTDKNGTIASAQLDKINANPQNFSFKYKGKVLLFTSADSTTYQYCNNTTNSSDNNVITTSTLLTITSSTGTYTIAEKVHNVVANSIHPANGGDLTNIQVGSKVYSIPSGDSINTTEPITAAIGNVTIAARHYTVGEQISKAFLVSYPYIPARLWIPVTSYGHSIIKVNDVVFITTFSFDDVHKYFYAELTCIKEGDVAKETLQYLHATFYEVNKA